MGIIRLTLITSALLAGGMLWYGRDEGLPEQVIGRVPAPEPTVVVPNPALDAPAEPASEPVPEPVPEPVSEPEPVAEPALQPEPATPSEPGLDTALDAAVDDVLAGPAPEPVPEGAVVVGLPETDATPADEGAPGPLVYVTGSAVNVRSGPDTSYEAITSLGYGTPVEDLGDAGEGWRRIRLIDGGSEIGYMSGDFLAATLP